MSKVQNVFLIGAKSLGAYGGYETFVYKLTEYHQNNPNIKYHVACKANGDGCMENWIMLKEYLIQNLNFIMRDALKFIFLKLDRLRLFIMMLLL